MVMMDQPPYPTLFLHGEMFIPLEINPKYAEYRGRSKLVSITMLTGIYAEYVHS